MQEYFATDKKNNEFVLSSQDLFHIEKVLRMKQGDHIIVTYDEEKYDCIVSFSSGIRINIVRKLDINNELTVDVTLIYGLPKKDKFEMVIQKSCELGVSSIVPFMAKRSVVILDEKNTDKKLQRWEMIAKEACEQSKRNTKVKILNPINLKDIKMYMSELNLVAYEDLSCLGNKLLFSLLEKKPKSITIIVGPEGGFDKEEISYLNEIGFISVSLGKRILRSETAPLYLLSVISFMNEREI